MDEQSSGDGKTRDKSAEGGFAEAVLRTVALYAFAGWVYIALNAVVHPETLRLPLTHFVDWPREDTFGAACFAVSFATTLLARILRVRRVRGAEASAS